MYGGYRFLLPKPSRVLEPVDSLATLSGLFSREPDPGFAAEVGEQSRVLLEGLADDELRQIALAEALLLAGG